MARGTWPDEEEARERNDEHGLWWGVVTSTADPEKRGRVRVRIPGLNETASTWAESAGGVGSGGGRHGTWAVPKLGATVLVGFIHGDVDSPVYWPGPTPTSGRGDDYEPENIILESDSFRILLREEGGTKKLRFETRSKDLLPNVSEAERSLVESFIEISTEAGDGKAHAVLISAPTAISIKSKGAIEIDAPRVIIKGRNVLKSPKPL